MIRLFRNAVDFLSVMFMAGGISFSLLLFASEIKLAALKKAKIGSSKLSTFTQKKTGIKIIK